MGIDDKAKNAAESLTGKGKESLGKVTGDRSMRAEGKADQSKASLKKAWESLKDAFKR